MRIVKLGLLHPLFALANENVYRPGITDVIDLGADVTHGNRVAPQRDRAPKHRSRERLGRRLNFCLFNPAIVGSFEDVDGIIGQPSADDNAIAFNRHVIAELVVHARVRSRERRLMNP